MATRIITYPRGMDNPTGMDACHKAKRKRGLQEHNFTSKPVQVDCSRSVKPYAPVINSRRPYCLALEALPSHKRTKVNVLDLTERTPPRVASPYNPAYAAVVKVVKGVLAATLARYSGRSDLQLIIRNLEKRLPAVLKTEQRNPEGKKAAILREKNYESRLRADIRRLKREKNEWQMLRDGTKSVTPNAENFTDFLLFEEALEADMEAKELGANLEQLAVAVESIRHIVRELKLFKECTEKICDNIARATRQHGAAPLIKDIWNSH